jgi:hypothetical protein
MSSRPMAAMTDPGEIRERYRRFAALECKGYSDRYHRLALAAADDGDVIDFLSAVPDPQPNLFLASIQFLTGPLGMPATGAAVRAFLARHGAEVGELMRSRRTQTNEVGRCAVLLPALPPGPLALVDVGASAGLCLLLDRFHYEFEPTPTGPTSPVRRGPPASSVRVGPAASSVRLRCAISGPVPVPAAVPAVVWRQGLDLNPLDARDDAAVRWLLACVWPDHVERRRRLECAIELARARPPIVRAGDLVDDLPALLADAPGHAQLVVFHSAVLSYVAPDRRREFAEALARESMRRDVVWLSNEARGIVPEITALAPASGEHRFLLGRTRLSGGRRRDELVGLAHPHGAELRWL